MGFTIHKEAPKTILVTMGQGDREMGKEPPSYEKNPELYHYRPGTTEPELVNPVDNPEGAETISKEPASKAGPVGAKGEPKADNKKK